MIPYFSLRRTKNLIGKRYRTVKIFSFFSLHFTSFCLLWMDPIVPRHTKCAWEPEKIDIFISRVTSSLIRFQFIRKNLPRAFHSAFTRNDALKAQSIMLFKRHRHWFVCCLFFYCYNSFIYRVTSIMMMNIEWDMITMYAMSSPSSYAWGSAALFCT